MFGFENCFRQCFGKKEPLNPLTLGAMVIIEHGWTLAPYFAHEIVPTECPKIYRKSVLHRLQYRFAVNFGTLGM